MRFFDSFIKSSEEIGIDPIYGTFLDLRNYLLTTIVFPLKSLIMHFMPSGSFVFTSTRYTIYLCPSFVYLRESRALVWVNYLQNLFDGLTVGFSNLCETFSIITAYSAAGVQSIGLLFLGSYFLYMDSKASLNVEFLEMDTNLLKNPENLLKPDLIYISGR